MLRNYSFVINFILYLILLMVNTPLNVAKEESCYQPSFIRTAWTDRRPRHVVNMTFSPDGSISTLTTVTRVIPRPVSMMLVTKIENGKTATLLNVTAKLCDFEELVNKVPVFKQIAEVSLQQGNYSFKCPMTPGVYKLENIQINGHNPMLRFIYRSKAVLRFRGGLYEELSNKTLMDLSTYDIIGKVIKRPCTKKE